MIFFLYRMKDVGLYVTTLSFSLADGMGMKSLERFGDSTGRLADV